MNDIFEKEDFQGNVIRVLFKNYFKTLDAISKNKSSTYNSLRRETGFSNGLVYHLLKDLKLTKLIINGYGYKLTDLGEKWLREWKEKGKIDKDILKETCLNVPYFYKVYNENPELDDYKKLYKLFLNLAPEDIDKKIIGSVTKRYMEGIHGIRIKVGSMMGVINKRTRVNQETLINSYQEKEDNDKVKGKYTIEEASRIIYDIQNQEIKSAIKKYGKSTVIEVIKNL